MNYPGQSKKKNILLMIPELGYGGAEKTLLMLSVDLKRYHNVYIALFNNTQKTNYEIGGEIIDLRTKPSNTIFHSIYNFLKRAYEIRKIKKSLKIDVTISFLEGADYINIASKFRDKIVLCVVGSKIYDYNIKGFQKFLRLSVLLPFFYKNAHTIVTNCEGLKNELIDYFKIESNKIHVIYNYIDLKKITDHVSSNIPESFIELFNFPVLVTHSRLSIEKGIDYQLYILKEVLKKDDKVKLLIIGDGPYKKYLFQLCEKLKLSYLSPHVKFKNIENVNVIFSGYQSNPFNLINRSDIYLFTSYSEGMSNSVMEAMGCKKIILAADCPYGPREIILGNSVFNSENLKYPVQRKTGILLPVIKSSEETESIKLWSENILDIIYDKEKINETGKYAYERVKEFSYFNNIQAWLKVIQM